jgi:hypothetical protein
MAMLRSKLSYANVMATIAVFVAVGTGGAYAANTIGSADIIDGEVKAVDVGNNEIGSADVKDGTLNTFDVHSFLGVDVVDGSLTGADLATESVASGQIKNSTIESQDIVTGGVQADDVSNGGLKDEDIAEGAFVHFTADIGVVPANSCLALPITGVDAQGDHLVLTPNEFTTNGVLSYTAEYDAGNERAWLKACNHFTQHVEEGTIEANLLVIDAG